MEKTKRLESALSRGKKTADTAFGFFRGLPDSYHKAKKEKSELAVVDSTIYGDLRDLLLYSAKYFGSKPQLEFGSGEAADEFYDILASKLDRDVYKRLRNKDITRISNKLEDWAGGLYGQSHAVVSSLQKTYGSSANFSIALPLSVKQVTGLVSSYLLNNSEKAHKIKFRDGKALTTEYLGAFAKSGKSVIVYGDTGKNFGYKSEDGSSLYSYDSGIDKIGRLRTAMHSVTDSFQRDVRWLLGPVGGMFLSAAGISSLQYQNILPFILLPHEVCTPREVCHVSNVNTSLLKLILLPIGGPAGNANIADILTMGAFCIFVGKFLYDSAERYKERRYSLDFAKTEDKNMKTRWGAVQTAAIANADKKKIRIPQTKKTT